MISLKRNWIGWENIVVCPGTVRSRSSDMSSTSLALLMGEPPSRRHVSRGFNAT